MAYLMSGIVDLDLDEGDIQEQIRHGRFRLFDYASFYWPVLLYDLISVKRERTNNQRDESLARLLKRVAMTLQNFDYITKEPREGHEVNRMWSFLNNGDLESNGVIRGAKEFHSNEKRWDWNINNSKEYQYIHYVSTHPHRSIIDHAMTQQASRG